MDEFDDDWDNDDWESDDDATETVPCPNCQAAVYEDAELCPYCGEYFTRSTSIWSNRPWWWIALGLVGILAVILALSGVSAFG